MSNKPDDKPSSGLTPWDKRNDAKKLIASGRFVTNGIECPHCKLELFDDKKEQLLSYPPQRSVYCLSYTCFKERCEPRLIGTRII